MSENTNNTGESTNNDVDVVFMEEVRPCEWYMDEFKDCISIRARIHQYFVHGECVDCSQWRIDYENCMHFRKKRDIESLEKIIESENERYQTRLKAAMANDVWEYRSEPPENWNSPMPEWMVEKKKNSLLKEAQKLVDQGISPPPVFSGIRCTIM